MESIDYPEFDYNPLTDVFTLEGIEFSRMFFRKFATFKGGDIFYVIRNEHGVIAIGKLPGNYGEIENDAIEKA